MAYQGTYDYHTICEHKRPVVAGTVVNFAIDPEPDSRNHTFEWQVEGPFTGMVQRYPGRRTFDWDTDGLRAGTYRISARLFPVLVETNSADGGSNGTTGSTGAFDLPGSGGNRGFSAVSVSTPPTGTTPPPGDIETEPWSIQLTPAPAGQDGPLPVSLQRTANVETIDQALWVIIRDRTNAIGFRPYKAFIDAVMGTDKDVVTGAVTGSLPFRGGDAYALLKFATDAFLMQEVGVLDPLGVVRAGLVQPSALSRLNSDLALQSISDQLDDPTQAEALRLQEERRLGRPFNLNELRRLRDNYFVALKGEIPDPRVLPYLQVIRERLADIPLKPPGSVPDSSYGILRSHLTAPLAIELFWSYWLEEGMLAQAMNAILARFENRRIRADGRPDPLARYDIDPLRPLGNIFWGFAQDEVHRLTVRRRHLEYEHEYGLPLHGRALRDAPQPVDRRSRFLESLHNLLYLCHDYFRQDDDTTIIADGFPILNALRETHLLLAEGAHNQFGDLPSTARSEMMIMQWLLARPEMRDFLGGRTMVPYEEAWMDRVDSMKSMQEWTDVSITHFRDLAVFGEQLLISVRYGNWSVENDPQTAANWARYWRAEIQRYVHAYRAATGVDLTEEIDATPPAVLLRRRQGDGGRPQLDGTRRPALDGSRRPALTGRREGGQPASRMRAPAGELEHG
ncbi:hypothetical protein [Actinoplanes sp. NPDC020271]|uniref:hypothetical protein n=1 Tax=Actinoplanes sp. NPDC020271 TaxID=3363896 RepID=UPI0037A56A09